MSLLSPSQAADIKEYTYGLTLLWVAVDHRWYRKFTRKFESFFDRLILVDSGTAGAAQLNQLNPDILILCSPLPDMESLDFLRQLPESPNRIPSIVCSDSISMDFVTASVNLGVSRFLTTTATPDETLLAIGALAREIFAKRALSTLVNQEMELLRYRTRYHSQQQEMALRKEQHLLRNDLPGGMVELGLGETRSPWFVGIIHTPHDIMCGDAYMVRRLDSGDLLLFLVDAMGSGLSASLTAVSATSCLNFLVDLYERENRFVFHRLVDCFLAHCRTLLLDDEVISFGFIHVQQSTLQGTCALFALPPLQIIADDGTVSAIRGVNPPVTNLSDNWKLQRIDLSTAQGIVIHSDGVTDAEISADTLYGERLPADIRDTFFAAELYERFKQRVKNRDDDATCIRLSGFKPAQPFYTLTISNPSCCKISDSLRQFEESLQIIPASHDWKESLVLAVGEALMNALEHGCLGMGGVHKQQLISDGRYDQALNQIATAESITISAQQVRLGIHTAIIVEIRDSGRGFNVKEMLSASASNNNFQGRGKSIIRSMVNHMSYNFEGNAICLIKYLEAGEHNHGNKK